jgi:hypothetical protein
MRRWRRRMVRRGRVHAGVVGDVGNGVRAKPQEETEDRDTDEVEDRVPVGTCGLLRHDGE